MSGAAPRIGLVIGQLHRGGGENQLAKLALGLKRGSRFEPWVYCLSDIIEPHGPILQEHGLQLRVLPHRNRGKLARALELRRLLRSDGISIAHAFLLGPSLHAALAVSGSTIFMSSIRTAEWKRPALKRRMERWALNRAAMVTVNSTAALSFVGSYYGVPAGKMRFIPNGVEPLGERLPGRREARQQLGLHPTAPVLLGLFRLSPEKELKLFCDVAETAFEGIPDGQCLIAGDGPERKWLEDRVARSPRQNLFSLLGARDDVPRLLAAADLLMLTSRSEGMPNSVLEAMSAGLPVVATRVGGLPDIVEQGVTGHLREAGDRVGLAAACRELLVDKERRVSMGLRAREAAEQRFSVECMVEAYETIYRELLEERAG